jgi:quinol monooxygenase YgiN
MIHVIAVITTKPGLRDSVLKLFGEIVPAVHGEEGCIEYGAAVDFAPAQESQTLLGADTFMVVEKWESAAALDAHSKAPHMVAYRGKVKDMIAHRAIHVLSPA